MKPTALCKSWVYDSLGRVVETTTSIVGGGDYTQQVAYDQYGRAYRSADSADAVINAAWQGQTIENVYNQFGFLNKVIDPAANSSEALYTVLDMDARGNVIESRQGNGVTMSQTYHPLSGQIETKKAFNSLNVPLQDIHYQWDELGNLKHRQDMRNGHSKKEIFDYDNLNRLTSYQIEGRSAINVQYDDFGNIKHKSDVGDYYYGGSTQCSTQASVHAVCKISNNGSSQTFEYDNNGNMTEDTELDGHGGRTITYSIFEKPLSIEKGSHLTQFEYGPDRARYKRTDTNTQTNQLISTTYYLGSVEKTIFNDRIEVKRYLPGGAMLTETYDVAMNALSEAVMQYRYFDHLGSLDVIADNAGTGN